MSTIDSVLATAERTWINYGVLPGDRAALVADVRQDLEAAAADGVDPGELIGTDVAVFARSLADEAGLRRVPPAYAKVLGAGLGGMLLGGGVGALLALLFVPVIRAWSPAAEPTWVFVPLYYSLPALAVVATTILTLRRQLPDLPRIERTGWWAAGLVPAAGLLVTPLTMGFAATTGYSTSPDVVFLEVMMVAGALLGAVALARRLAVHRDLYATPEATPAAA